MSRKASQVPIYPCFKQLTTRGTFYDVGYNVGLSFSPNIKLFFAESNNIQDKLLPFYDSQAGRDYYEESLRVCQDCFPQYVREVRGMADGAGMSFEHVFMANVSKEVYNVLFAKLTDSEESSQDSESEDNPPRGKSAVQEEPSSQEKSSSQDKSLSQENSQDKTSPKEMPTPEEEPEPQAAPPHSPASPAPEPPPFQEDFGCSDVFLNRPGYQYVVHNEDCDPMIKPYGYLLSAEIEEEGCAKEQFTSFCYPGFLPGCAFSYNVHGLTISINGLYPDHVVRESPSRLFVNRSLLSACDLPDVIRLARNEPYGCAYGFCANVTTKEGRMTSLEVGPAKPQALTHVYDVTQGEDPDADCHYYHFNSYKHLSETCAMKNLKSSTQRAKRVNELPPPRTVQQALKVMADTHDPLRPIFRTPRPTDRGETVCTAAFDVTARQVLIYQGREDLLSDTPFVRLPMYQ